MMAKLSFSLVRPLAVVGLIGALFAACITGMPSPGFARNPPDTVNISEPEQKADQLESETKLAQRRIRRNRPARRSNNNRRRRFKGNNTRQKRSRRGFDNQQSRRAINAGQALSLGQIARRVRRRVPGQLLDARLMNGRGGRLIYRLKILGKNGVMRNVTTDAHTGSILNVR